MVRSITAFVLLFWGMISEARAQQTTWDGPIDFEFPTAGDVWIYRDTVANPQNVWQQGPPQKTVFTTAFSGNKVMVTDTINSYPINDTSVFIIGQTVSSSWVLPGGLTAFTGHYSVHSDSLADYGTMEISINKGQSWIDVLEDSVFDFFGSGGKPVLTGNSNGWQSFQMFLGNLADSAQLSMGDTVLMRFSFISDGVQTNKDGLMFDALYFYDWHVSVQELGWDLPARAFPNPAGDQLRILPHPSFHYNAASVIILNALGQQVRSAPFSGAGPILLELTGLPKGMYYYRVAYDGARRSAGRFIKR